MNERLEKYVIREAVLDDFEQTRGLLETLSPGSETSSIAQRYAFEQILNDERMHLFVAENAAGTLISTCMLAIVPNLTHSGSPFAIIENVVTLFNYRGLGLGAQIMAHAVETAKRRGCYKVTLAARSENTRAHQFYRRAKFTQGDKIFFQRRFA